MNLAAIVKEYQGDFSKKVAGSLLPGQKRAMEAIKTCREPECGELVVVCPRCGRQEFKRHSCGHRHCPKCQNHEATQWLERQRRKLLPVRYFLVTFTVPASLRKPIYAHQRQAFDCLFQAARESLEELATNERYLGGKIGMTGVLHTHSRRLDFHPHIHFLVPAGCLKGRAWKRKRWKFLFPEEALADLFRGRFLGKLAGHKIPLPRHISESRWVVHCQLAGTGAPALDYLARYLYRGVIAENRIIRNRDGRVTFRYRESKTGCWKTRTETGEDFLRLVFQHVLPKGFRRVRDYGFLHGNAKKTLARIQLILRVRLPDHEEPRRPAFRCSACGAEMQVIARRILRSVFEVAWPARASP